MSKDRLVNFSLHMLWCIIVPSFPMPFTVAFKLNMFTLFGLKSYLRWREYPVKSSLQGTFVWIKHISWLARLGLLSWDWSLLKQDWHHDTLRTWSSSALKVVHFSQSSQFPINNKIKKFTPNNLVYFQICYTVKKCVLNAVSCWLWSSSLALKLDPPVANKSFPFIFPRWLQTC